MGGNAFPEAQRLTKTEYESACRYVEAAAVMHDIKAVVPLSYRAKDSFGDVDVLVSRASSGRLQVLLDDLRPLNTTKNPSGDNLLLESHTGKLYQLDLILTEDETFGFATWYFAYNDLGNLIGRIAHRQGLKFGHDGLWYIYRDGTQVLDEIQLTDSFTRALDYLGFNADVYFGNGFETLESMFEWVVDSKFFEASAFPLEHRNHKARVRDAKRKNYNLFLQYLKDYNFDMTYEPSDRDAWLAKHIMNWPDLGRRIEEADARPELNRAWKEKVGGHRVMELTGLEGKELGEFMRHVRAAFPVTHYTVATPQETLDIAIMRLYNNQKAVKDL